MHLPQDYSTMPRGKLFSDHEKAQILALRHAFWTIRGIAEHIWRSPSSVLSFLRNLYRTNARKSSRNAKKLATRQIRILLRVTCKGESSANQHCNQISLPSSVRRVQQILHEAPLLTYIKMFPGQWCCNTIRTQGWVGLRSNWKKMRLNGSWSSSQMRRSSAWTSRMALHVTGTTYGRNWGGFRKGSRVEFCYGLGSDFLLWIVVLGDLQG